MNIQYDPKVDAMYISLGQGTYSKSRKISASIMVDEDAQGKILGIEILSAKKNIPAFKVNEVTKIDTISRITSPALAGR